MQHHHAPAEQACLSKLTATVKTACQGASRLRACTKLMAFPHMDTRASHLHAAAQLVLSVRGMQMQGCSSAMQALGVGLPCPLLMSKRLNSFRLRAERLGSFKIAGPTSLNTA